MLVGETKDLLLEVIRDIIDLLNVIEHEDAVENGANGASAMTSFRLPTSGEGGDEDIPPGVGWLDLGETVSGVISVLANVGGEEVGEGSSEGDTGYD